MVLAVLLLILAVLLFGSSAVIGVFGVVLGLIALVIGSVMLGNQLDIPPADLLGYVGLTVGTLILALVVFATLSG